MSWQSYVDDQLIASKQAKYGAICGLDGNIWAKSADWAITPDQISAIKANMGDDAKMGGSGIKLADTKYFYLSGDEGIVRGKKGTGGVHIAKTTQALVIAAYEEGIQPEQCATVVEKLADYLKSVGY